ncbi:hypothetical protein H0E87_021609 [Populus deltoides]|uniref:Uncharacterized protein n=1 Tax=Populus deltoides TaxID=3696 RepID=A0A8T2XI66_POPDE|nr:hypothetical protein H0E87_021609 [Populus deltoides]KAH8492084.1 hypothetical protein H0E87_021609 [Populus deltoides]
MRIAGGDGLWWRSVGFGFVEYRGINLLLQRKKIATATWRKGRDRRRLKLSTLTVYGKEQDIGIEALEAMLMDMMNLEVRLAGCSIIMVLCFFLFPGVWSRSYAMLL